MASLVDTNLQQGNTGGISIRVTPEETTWWHNLWLEAEDLYLYFTTDTPFTRAYRITPIARALAWGGVIIVLGVMYLAMKRLKLI